MGVSPQAMKWLDKEYVQQRLVMENYAGASMDDLTAALVNFNFRMLVEGSVKYMGRPSGRHTYQVIIRRVGIYVRDSYGFEDDESSFWSAKT